MDFVFLILSQLLVDLPHLHTRLCVSIIVSSCYQEVYSCTGHTPPTLHVCNFQLWGWQKYIKTICPFYSIGFWLSINCRKQHGALGHGVFVRFRYVLRVVNYTWGSSYQLFLVQSSLDLGCLPSLCLQGFLSEKLYNDS